MSRQRSLSLVECFLFLPDGFFAEVGSGVRCTFRLVEFIRCLMHPCVGLAEIGIQFVLGNLCGGFLHGALRAK